MIELYSDSIIQLDVLEFMVSGFCCSSLFGFETQIPISNILGLCRSAVAFCIFESYCVHVYEGGSVYLHCLC